jgi:hypothetical protein
MVSMMMTKSMKMVPLGVPECVVGQNPPAGSDWQYEELGGFWDSWWAPVPRSTAQRSGAHPGLKLLGVPPDPAPDQEGVTCRTSACTDIYKN